MDALVKNAASEKQVKSAGRKEMNRSDREMNDIRHVLNERQGRRFLWRLLEKTKVFESIWEQSAKIHYNAGKQDFGHFLLSEITKASEDAYFKMMTEAKQDAQKEKH